MWRFGFIVNLILLMKSGMSEDQVDLSKSSANFGKKLFERPTDTNFGLILVPWALVLPEFDGGIHFLIRGLVS